MLNKCFMLPLSENWENISFLLTEVSWSNSGTTEKLANAFSGIIINFSPILESISVHKSLDTIESSSIYQVHKLFLKAAFDLSFKPSGFIPILIPRPEWMVVPTIFTANISVGPSKRTRLFSGSLRELVTCELRVNHVSYELVN